MAFTLFIAFVLDSERILDRIILGCTSTSYVHTTDKVGFIFIALLALWR